MTEQLFYVCNTNRKFFLVAEVHFRIRSEGFLTTILSSTSALIRITHSREEPVLLSEFMLDNIANTTIIELLPEQLNSILQGHYFGAQPRHKAGVKEKKLKGQKVAPKQTGRRLRKKSNITERLANRVLDRISQVGMEGLNKFELRLIERYSEDLRLINDQKKRRA